MIRIGYFPLLRNTQLKAYITGSRFSACPGLIKVSLLPLLLMMVSELPMVNESKKCFPEPTYGSPPPFKIG